MTITYYLLIPSCFGSSQPVFRTPDKAQAAQYASELEGGECKVSIETKKQKEKL